MKYVKTNSLSYRKYVRLLLSILTLIVGSTFLYSYHYSKYYPVPITNRVSLDAKLMFIRDFENRDKVDTIIMGSSIGLDNVDGKVLESASKTVNNVLNISAFSMEISHMAQLTELIALFPNTKRIVYSAQSLDFTGSSRYKHPNINFIKEYIYLGKENTNFKYTFLTFKNFINILKRRMEWNKKYMAHNNFHNLDFDYTGGISLEIYGKDIIQERWNRDFIARTNQGSYDALDGLIKKLKEQDIKFYFFAQPYRQQLVKEHKKIRTILTKFHKKSEAVVVDNQAYFLNLHDTTNLQDAYFADRIHLNAKGSVIMAKEIASFIDNHESKVNR
ncbi:MAG: Unknown protein [uncultured Sulfurovum sp.]|uniref:SGNH hydrolase-type esterase domain-containing protein n=1 Tax=uncultured Sulfurovum sp. TaxID=269237 RepID=A0A6S6TNR6_9BACT|nr:MAG: Unknown protein [uncultured Sulfurovum sp.]